MTNSKLLFDLINSFQGGKETVSKHLSISIEELEAKINNRNEFTVSEIFLLSNLVGINNVMDIFFCKSS